jgi:hypothetical protein
MQMAYNLTDMFWLGRLRKSVTAVAGQTGLAGMFFMAGMALMMIGRDGAEIAIPESGPGRRPSAAQGFAQEFDPDRAGAGDPVRLGAGRVSTGRCFDAARKGKRTCIESNPRVPSHRGPGHSAHV